VWSHGDAAVQRELITAGFTAYAELTRARRQRKFRWTNQDLRFDVDVLLQRVHVHGVVLLRRMRTRLVQTLRSALPTTWNVTHALRTAEDAACWHVLNAPVTRVWRQCPDHTDRLSLATELRLQDGPVRVLASTANACLIQALDGTTGWTLEPIHKSAWPQPWVPNRQRRSRAADVARSFVGVLYKLGGTTREGVDCSGLTQTIYRDVLGAIIPKHCCDQFAYGTRTALNARELPLVFLQQNACMPPHVGILLRRGRHEWCVVHASSRRRLVVEESLEEFVHGRGWNVAAW